ncbi:hypothetical protein SPBR_03801 [Sporothrix brasiliensis 5110]|uniref:Uncharacterized protein n=1 Tax=Sporothrix brasiliensis 5110 TaxID=1398154 RepID=A0A0C2FV84_9PEZI|nr:uncharacterized protein SPBR_03801 [Sporothrix brasiliensis 5110]KIH94958.1 hypothetical protein SPBR_03801 [Sporothrix brasiliensis 5110]
MSDDGVVVSPVEADIDVPMGEGQTSQAAEKGTETPVVPTLQSSVPPQSISSPAQETPPATIYKLPPTRVTSAIPAMFVPLRADADLTQPFDPPRSRIERAKAMLDTLEYYRTGVREGFLYLADMDRRHIIGAAMARKTEMAEARAAKEARESADAAKEAETYEAAPNPAESTTSARPSTDKGKGKATEGGVLLDRLPPTDNLLLDDDETISHDEIDVMIATMRAPAVPGVDYNTAPYLDQHLPLRFPVEAGEVRGGRRASVRQLSEVIEQALGQMSGFDAHMGQLRATWTENLEREQKLLDERFGSLPGDREARAAAETEDGRPGSNSGSGTAAEEPQDVAMSGT